MFRKIINLLTVFSLLIATTGIAISKHYCGDMIVSVAIDAKAESCCGTACDCCHTEYITLKLNEDFMVQSICLKFDPPESDYLFVKSPDYLDNIDLLSRNMLPEAYESPPVFETEKILSLLQAYLC